MKKYIQPQVQVITMDQETPILDTSLTTKPSKPSKDNDKNIYSVGGGYSDIWVNDGDDK